MLINCAVYQHGKKLADLVPERSEELAAYLERPDCFVWIALRDPEPSKLEPYRRLFNLHALAVEDAISGQQRPKFEEYGEDLFAVMHLVDWVGGDLSLGEVAVFVGANYVLSVRRGSKLHFLGVRERCEREPELLAHGPSFVLYALMDAVVDRYFPIVDLLESELEEIEQSIFVRGAQLDNIKRLYEPKRRLMLLRRAVALQEGRLAVKWRPSSKQSLGRPPEGAPASRLASRSGLGRPGARPVLSLTAND